MSKLPVKHGDALPSPEAQIGAQLTAQYQKAIGGMREVLVFGAMLMQIRTGLAQHGELEGRRAGIGLKAWLQDNAPEINLSTAYRFLGIAEAVGNDYAQIVGTKVSKAYSLEQLVTAPADSLPEQVRAKQLDLFSYVSGTSHRSWMDKLKAKDLETRGGARTASAPSGDGRQKAKAQTAHDTLQDLVAKLRNFAASPVKNLVDHAFRAECAKALQDACKELAK